MLPTPDIAEPSLPDRLSLVLRHLLRTVAAKLHHRPWLNPLLLLLTQRLDRLAARFTALHARFRAGTLRQPRANPARPKRSAPRAMPGSGLPFPRLPPGAWLIPVVAYGGMEVRALHGLRSLLEHLLHTDTELAALLAAAPQAARLLRPLCRMLEIDAPRLPEAVTQAAPAIPGPPSRPAVPAWRPPPSAPPRVAPVAKPDFRARLLPLAA